MRAALICQGSKSSTWTLEAMRKYFDHVDEIKLKDIEISFTGKKEQILYQGKLLEKYDAIYAKGSFKFANVLCALTNMLSKHSYMPISASSFNIAHDKLLTQLKMHTANIPMPETFLSSTVRSAKAVIKKMNFPIIMKFLKGTQGKGVMFADSRASALSILDALDVLKQPVILQEYIETDGTDIRAIVIGDKVVAAYKRISQTEDKRANFYYDARGEALELDDKTKKIAIAAAKVIEADICAVDILEGATGPLVIEANLSPGLQGITKFTKIDVADEIAKFIYKKAEEFKSVKTQKSSKSIIMNLGIEDSAKESHFTEMITNLDFRAERILLPELVCKKLDFNDSEEVVIKFMKNKLIVEKF